MAPFDCDALNATVLENLSRYIGNMTPDELSRTINGGGYDNFIETSKNMPLTSSERNISFLVGHFGFFIFNVINVVVLVAFEGYAFDYLRKNRAAQFMLAACTIQLLSCATSLHRYNLNDEFGVWAKAGMITGTIAITLMTWSYLHLICRDNVRNTVFWMCGTSVIAAAVIGMSYWHWEEKNFFYFRLYLFVSVVSYGFIMLFAGQFQLRKGNIEMTRDISNTTMKRVWWVLIGLDFLHPAISLADMPAFTYPLTGMVYMISMVNSVCVGRMSFVKENLSSGVT